MRVGMQTVGSRKKTQDFFKSIQIEIFLSLACSRDQWSMPWYVYLWKDPAVNWLDLFGLIYWTSEGAPTVPGKRVGFVKKNVSPIEWLLYSSDLNPIESVRSFIKNLHAETPSTAGSRGNEVSKNNFSELWDNYRILYLIRMIWTIWYFRYPDE